MKNSNEFRAHKFVFTNFFEAVLSEIIGIIFLYTQSSNVHNFYLYHLQIFPPRELLIMSAKFLAFFSTSLPVDVLRHYLLNATCTVQIGETTALPMRPFIVLTFKAS